MPHRHAQQFAPHQHQHQIQSISQRQTLLPRRYLIWKDLAIHVQLGSSCTARGHWFFGQPPLHLAVHLAFYLEGLANDLNVLGVGQDAVLQFGLVGGVGQGQVSWISRQAYFGISGCFRAGCAWRRWWSGCSPWARPSRLRSCWYVPIAAGRYLYRRLGGRRWQWICGRGGRRVGVR